MHQQLKQTIAIAVQKYAEQKQLSNNDVARLTGVNAGYISAIFRQQFTTDVNGKISPIGDRWFLKLADWAGVEIKKTYWKTIATRHFQEIISRLEDAKKNVKTVLIVGDTGFGKSYAIDKFCNTHPLHTYRITVSAAYKIDDIVLELGDKLGIETNTLYGKRVGMWSRKSRLEKITNKLIDLRQEGYTPIVIIDEAENVDLTTLKMIKGIYDAIYEHCSIVLIGTEKILYNLLKGGRLKEGLPQLYRRFKAGIKELSPVDKVNDFQPFFDLYKIDKGLQKLLCYLCDNYGNLKDYVLPVLMEADEKNIPLTEDLFRLYHDLPNTKK